MYKNSINKNVIHTLSSRNATYVNIARIFCESWFCYNKNISAVEFVITVKPFRLVTAYGVLDSRFHIHLEMGYFLWSHWMLMMIRRLKSHHL